MKRFLAVALGFLILITFTACAGNPGPASSAVPSETISSTPASASASTEAIVFSDVALETKVREVMGKPTEDITVEEAKAVLKLDLSNESFDDMNSKNGGIRDIDSLKYFTGLELLDLSFNDIDDFTPLAGLKSLETLFFNGVRPKDLNALKDLTNMVCLVFDWSYAPDQGHNGYESLNFVSNMKNLEVFEAKNAGVKDITALGTLPKLWSVFLCENQITDVSPLANLQNLRELELSDNPITDFSPLKEVYPKLQYHDFEME